MVMIITKPVAVTSTHDQRILCAPYFCFTYSVTLLIILMMTTLVQEASSEVHRLYSPIGNNGHSIACTDDRVIMTCNATGSRLTWTTTSNLRGRIVFVNTDQTWTVINQDTITGILLQNDPSDNNLRTFVSELLVFASRSSQAINVTCSSDSGSSSHIISPPAHPEPPIFKDQYVLLSESKAIAQYFLEWEPPANLGDIDLDHYELYIGENLVQKVHHEQRYAVINIQNGLARTIVKLASIDRCGQISNFSLMSIVPLNRSDPEVETTITESTVTDQEYTTAMATDIQTASSATLLTIYIVFASLISVLLLSFVIVCTCALRIWIRLKHHHFSESDTEMVSAKNNMMSNFKAVEYEASEAV